MAAQYLVIVESPSKAKTIGKYLGPAYTVKASMTIPYQAESKQIVVICLF